MTVSLKKLAPHTGAPDRNFDALRDTVSENSDASGESEEDNHDEKAKKVDERRRVSSGSSSYCKVEPRTSQFQEDLLGYDPGADFDDSTDHLSEVPVKYSLQPLQSGGEMKDQEKSVHNEVSKHIGGKSSPSAAKSTEIRSLENGSSVCIREQEKQNPKHLSIVPMPRTPDGYNWRKYGQKQVKSPEGSRSYYRCTFSDCYAKKIECCDISNRPTETVYRSHHNHDLQRLNCVREHKHALSSILPINRSNHLVKHLNDPVMSTTCKEHVMGLDEMPETKQEF